MSREPESGRTRVVVVAPPGSATQLIVQKAPVDIVAEAPNGAQAEKALAFVTADLVIVDQEVPGIPGVECLEFLHRAAPAARFVLVAPDEWTPADPSQVGAAAIVSPSELAEIVADARVLAGFLGASREEFVERRSGVERRQRQDWAAVGWERRSGTDRRS
ncbi:MAG: DNA-binding response regulator [Actinomyces sp.]|nr:MAG: DNA-binding response regulator [Actinomyces sp.]